MKLFIITNILLFTVNLFAADSQQFCEFLIRRAEIDPKSFLTSKDMSSQLSELMKINSVASSFHDLANNGIEKKMSWFSFKKYAASKGTTLSDYYQPQYDGMYMRKYCGTATTEASVMIEGGITTKNKLRRSFTLRPNPVEHEYFKDMSSAR